MQIKHCRTGAGLVALMMALTTQIGFANGKNGIRIDNIRVGSDANSAESLFVQPQNPALAGGSRDQSLQFGDVLRGSGRDDLIVGRLGIDVLIGNGGDDVLVGGLEHFNPLNRDRAIGGSGDDIFIWKPGDGSDFFAGDRGVDVVMFGLVGELVDGELVFAVNDDQTAGNLAISRKTRLPFVDVTNSPGFCDVIDQLSAPDAASELRDLGLDRLVQFSLRGIRDSFDNGEQADDNGLRVTLHLKNVEILVCTNRLGGEIEIFDLTTAPATLISLEHLNNRKTRKLFQRLSRMIR